MGVPLATAPVVKSSNSSHMGSLALTQGYNPGANIVLAPKQGPSHPFKQRGVGQLAEPANIEDWAFEEQYQNFQRSGYALDMDSNTVMGNSKEYFNNQRQMSKRPVRKDKSKRQRLNLPDEIGDPDDQSPWAPESDVSNLSGKSNEELADNIIDQTTSREGDAEEGEMSFVNKDENADSAPTPGVFIDEPDEEAEKWERVTERKMGFTMPARPARGSAIPDATSAFHGKELFDYQGRSWTSPPSGVRPETEEHQCYLPKKCIKKYTGHTKGVQAIEFIPGTGHLLLSGSMDGKCKIWDVYSDRNVRRTYVGHSEGVKSVNMNEKGTEFLSTDFDRIMRLWDVETGQAKGSFTNRKMGYDVKFRPTDNNIFLMAASDNKIYQWDARTGEVCQEYNYHLQPCNTVTFFDGGRKFVSTSDDKKLLVWEFDIPVPIKYIQEPDMHSMPAVTLNPSGDYFVGQSMNNTIVTYSCNDKVKEIKKKIFSGHNNSGYACKPGFSPNGQFLISGDGTGKLHCWDWKTTKSYRKLQCHDGACLGAVFHPLEPSWIATCGYDGQVKLWD